MVAIIFSSTVLKPPKINSINRRSLSTVYNYKSKLHKKRAAVVDKVVQREKKEREKDR
jgi:hypothetical protein